MVCCPERSEKSLEWVVGQELWEIVWEHRRQFRWAVASILVWDLAFGTYTSPAVASSRNCGEQVENGVGYDSGYSADVDHSCNIKVDRHVEEGFGGSWTTAAESRTFGNLFCKGYGYGLVPIIGIGSRSFEALQKVLMNTERKSLWMNLSAYVVAR